MSDDIDWMDAEEDIDASKSETIKRKPPVIRTPTIIKPKRVITVSLVKDEIVKHINPLEPINPDEIRLREILTASRGAKNRNETYQRNNIINPLIEFLIKQGWIIL